MRSMLALVVVLAGCGKLLGIEHLSGTTDGGGSGSNDGRVDDGGIDVMVPDQLTFSGTIMSLEGMPVSGANVDFIKSDSSIYSTTSDGMGGFTLMVPTDGAPLDGLFDVTTPDFKTRYVYQGLTGDVGGATFLYFTRADVNALASAGGVTQSVALSAVAGFVTDGGGGPIAGATFDSVGGEVRYTNDNDQTPSPDATATSNTGIAWVFNMPPGFVQLAANDGSTSYVSAPFDLPENTLEIAELKPL